MRADTSPDLAAAEEALASGDWERARVGFEAALAEGETPETHDGLGRALWWLGDVDGAIANRERAYAGFRRRGDRQRAARIALWVSREYTAVHGNRPASNGWLARAEGLIRALGQCPEEGWLALARADRADAAGDMLRYAEDALAIARRHGEGDLEAAALAHVGLARIRSGDVEEGLGRLDEAMAAATGGEVADPAGVGDVCCTVVLGCEEAADIDRLEHWGKVIEGFLERNMHAPLLSFCGTCCAEVFVANGKLSEAEEQLVMALGALQGTGHRARCVHPAAKLAELRILQGRLEEAERLLGGYEDLPDALRASASLHLARGEATLAAALLHRRLNQLGRDNLLAVPVLALLVQAQLGQGNAGDAADTVPHLRALAERSGQPRIAAIAAVAAGRVAAAAGEPSAKAHLESALETFSRLQMSLDAGRARMELARTLRDDEPEVAAREARLAQEAFEEAGASQPADEAAALVRELGGPARTGPKLLGLLSKREAEVLRLLGEGLTNAEIAARLFISTKTAGNHVSNVLAKLNLRSRSEAAAYVVRYLGGSSAAE